MSGTHFHVSHFLTPLRFRRQYLIALPLMSNRRPLYHPSAASTKNWILLHF